MIYGYTRLCLTVLWCWGWFKVFSKGNRFRWQRDWNFSSLWASTLLASFPGSHVWVAQEPGNEAATYFAWLFLVKPDNRNGIPSLLSVMKLAFSLHSYNSTDFIAGITMSSGSIAMKQRLVYLYWSVLERLSTSLGCDLIMDHLLKLAKKMCSDILQLLG